ncbi:uncharacterized protein F4812DRAFT_442088, partial [Daldinia caldariorum]|uniref:uncharacterized protein n=1 Tax=Daldinia caldariorum TaxID=326644 RepID=UPI002007CAE4
MLRPRTLCTASCASCASLYLVVASSCILFASSLHNLIGYSAGKHWSPANRTSNMPTFQILNPLSPVRYKVNKPPDWH